MQPVYSIYNSLFLSFSPISLLLVGSLSLVLSIAFTYQLIVLLCPVLISYAMQEFHTTINDALQWRPFRIANDPPHATCRRFPPCHLATCPSTRFHWHFRFPLGLLHKRTIKGLPNDSNVIILRKIFAIFFVSLSLSLSICFCFLLSCFFLQRNFPALPFIFPFTDYCCCCCRLNSFYLLMQIYK